MKRHDIVKCDTLEVDRKQNIVWTEGGGKEICFKHLHCPHCKLRSCGDVPLEQITDPCNCHPRSYLRKGQTVRPVFRVICLQFDLTSLL